MKRFCKIIFVLFLAVMLVLPSANVYAKKKKTTTTTTTTTANQMIDGAVNIYVFYSSTCGHCAALHEYLNELKSDKEVKDKFNIVDYEVSTEEGGAVLEKVSDYFSHSVDGVPFYVIGDSYYEGFGDASKETILKEIKDNYDSKDYQDIVAGILNGSITGNVNTSQEEKKSNDVVGMVILAITVIVIIVLIICSSKTKYYEDDEEDEEEVEVKETKSTNTKEKAKKQTTKKKNN